MHSAPAVRYPVARPSRARWVAAGAWAFGTGLCGWWSLLPGTQAWQMLLAGACVALAGGAAVVQWRAWPQGELYWDGWQWWWCGGAREVPVTLLLRLDAGAAMLLRIEGLAGRAPWCHAERRLAPGRWMDLRRAVHAARTAPETAMAEPAA